MLRYVRTLVVVLRLALTLLARLWPALWPLLLRGTGRVAGAEQLHACGRLARQLASWLQFCCLGVLEMLKVVAVWALAVFLDNSHLILSVLIFLASLLASVKSLSMVSLALREELAIIGASLSDLLQPSPDVQSTVKTTLDSLMQPKDRVHAPAEEDSLWDMGRSVVGAAMPEYQGWLESNGANFGALKYVLHDVWRETTWPSLDVLVSQAAGAASLGTSVHQAVGSAAKIDEVCADAIAAGASCFGAAAPSQPVQLQLKNTTALMTALVHGNLSAAFSLGRVAYDEVMAASSQLGGNVIIIVYYNVV